ncbi:MAG: hypothetical protein OSA95_04145, partial [Opitutales bacterium]|nr:hypothetical protein [Opitutales bacterium]
MKMQTNDTRSNNLKQNTLGGVARRTLTGIGIASGHSVGFAKKVLTNSTGGLCLHVSMLITLFALLV